MNPLLSPSNSLFIPLSQLNPHSKRLLDCLSDVRSTAKDKVLLEQTLWNEVKKIKSLNDKNLFLYLIGYYHILYVHISRLNSKPNLFHYNVLIRLGDLNRYLDRIDVAKYYYCNARNLCPNFGHAYNQLALLTRPASCYKCCYYYARAARSSEKPLNTIADSNLRIAVSKYGCHILEHILDNDESIDQSRKNQGQSTSSIDLPKSAFEWFYVMVVAIYADNVKPITKSFVKYLSAHLSKQDVATVNWGASNTIFCNRESYILLACLDILIDWLRLGSQGKNLLPSIGSDLRQIKHLLSELLMDMGYNSSVKQTVSNNIGNVVSPILNSPGVNGLSNNQTCSRVSTSSSGMMQDFIANNSDLSNMSSNSCSSTSSLAALPHDHILRGFSPLNEAHTDLSFTSRNDSMLSESLWQELDPPIQSVHEPLENLSPQIGITACDQGARCLEPRLLAQIVQRIKKKIDGFGVRLRGHTRNIALESIFSNIDKEADIC